MLRRQMLGLLSQGRRHGYALAKEHRQRTCLTGGSGNFYRELKHLCRAGMIRLVSAGTAADPRKVTYEITGAGAAEFRTWITDVPDVSACPESELATRAPLFFLLPEETGESLLGDWKRSIWSAIRRVEDTREAAGTGGQEKAIRDLLVQRRIRHLTLELEFVDELKSALATGRPSTGGADSEPANSVLAKRALPDGGRREWRR